MVKSDIRKRPPENIGYDELKKYDPTFCNLTVLSRIVQIETCPFQCSNKFYFESLDDRMKQLVQIYATGPIYLTFLHYLNL